MERRNSFLVGLLLIIVALVDFNIYAIHVPTPSLANALGMTLLSVAWFINGPLIAGASVLIVAGHVSHLYDNRHLLSYFLFIFAICSLLIAINNNDLILIVLRIIQGMSMGGMLILAILILRHLFPIENQVLPLVMLVATFAVTQTLGPLLFGIVTEFMDWHYIFILDTLVAIIAWLLYIRKNLNIAHTHIDITMRPSTIIALMISLFSLLTLFNNLPLWTQKTFYGWLFFLIGIASLFFYILGEYSEQNSIFRLPLLLTRSRLLLLSIVVFTTPIYMGVTFGINIYLQHVSGYSPLSAGLFILTLSASLAVGLIPVYLLKDTFSERSKLMFGTLCICVGLMIAIISNFIVSPLLILWMMLIGFGLSFSFLFAVERLFFIMYKEYWSVASAVVLTIWALAGSIGTAMTVIIIYYFGKLYSLQAMMQQQILLSPAQQQGLIHVFDGTATLAEIASQFTSQTSAQLIDVIHSAFIFGFSRLMWIFLVCAVVAFVIAYFVPKLEQPK